ncbi:MAG TPA: hypothetical protein VEV38_13910 [Candidatus Eremiobacteraceae bacterium]|nr:hypothetical protein [Candidatus Eremiobacteraceae bacterium]
MSFRSRSSALAVAIIFILSTIAQPAFAASCTWQQIKTPNLGDGVNELNSVIAFYVGNVWAVGDSSSVESGTYEDVIDHWDGMAWTSLAAGSAPLTQLLSVSGQNKNNVWTGGYATTTNDANTASPIALHFDGTQWKTTSPVVMSDWIPARFNAIAGVGSAGAWAVGSRNTQYGPQQLIEHWNGSKWVDYSIQIQQNAQSDLYAIAALSSKNIFALGSFSQNGQSGTMIEHYDGTAWTTSLESSDCLTTMTALQPSYVFAVGACGGSTAIDFFDGTKWSSQQGPSVDPSTIISGISARSLTGVLAVGQIPATRQGFAMFFDGNAWTNIAVPNPNKDTRILNATAQVPRLTEFWTVGTAIPKFGAWRAISVKPNCT